MATASTMASTTTYANEFYQENKKHLDRMDGSFGFSLSEVADDDSLINEYNDMIKYYTHLYKEAVALICNYIDEKGLKEQFKVDHPSQFVECEIIPLSLYQPNPTYVFVTEIDVRASPRVGKWRRKLKESLESNVLLDYQKVLQEVKELAAREMAECLCNMKSTQSDKVRLHSATKVFQAVRDMPFLLMMSRYMDHCKAVRRYQEYMPEPTIPNHLLI